MTKIEILVDKLSKPIVIISVIILSAVLAVTYGIMLNVQSDLQQQVNSMPIEVSKVEETGEIEVETIDVEAQKEQQVSKVEKEVAEMLCPQQELVDKARTYFNARYNYEGSLSSNKEKILTEVQDIITITQYNRLQTELQTSGAGNMGVKVPKVSKCEIIGIFTDYKKPSEYTIENRSALEITVYVAAIMNDSSEVLYNVSFVENSSVWLIDDVEFRTNRV